MVRGPRASGQEQAGSVQIGLGVEVWVVTATKGSSSQSKYLKGVPPLIGPWFLVHGPILLVQ
jgi:hypothetical protein